jgi:hypothetical protein
MHLHLVQFQILAVDGQPPPLIRMGWKDTMRINPHQTNPLIVPFEGYSGVYVFHCHMLEHAEHMMMGQFDVVAPGGFEPSAHRPTPLLFALCRHRQHSAHTGMHVIPCSTEEQLARDLRDLRENPSRVTSMVALKRAILEAGERGHFPGQTPPKFSRLTSRS